MTCLLADDVLRAPFTTGLRAMFKACLGVLALAKHYTPARLETAAARGTGQFLKALKWLQGTRVLILDDFLMTPASADDLANLLEIIEDRSQVGPLVITTQYAVADWRHLMADPTIADAICDRLVHTSTLFTLQGESQRKKNSAQDPSKG